MDNFFRLKDYTLSLQRVEDIPQTEKIINSLSNFTKASFTKEALGSFDLTHFKGILVTSGMNHNRDYFLPSEMLKTFTSILMKPINIEHEMSEDNGFFDKNPGLKTLRMDLLGKKNTIVGCIYDAAFVRDSDGLTVSYADMTNSSYVMPEEFDFDLMDQNVKNDMEKYHIVISAVLWNFLFPKTILSVVDGIKYKELALSMESLFVEYDLFMDGNIYKRYEHPEIESLYNSKVVAGGKPIGRVLRNPIWSAAGLVRNPANADAFSLMHVFANKENNELFEHICAAYIVKGSIHGGDENPEHIKNQGEKNIMENAENKTPDLTKLIETNASINEKLRVSEVERVRLENELNQALASVASLNKEVADTKAEAEKVATEKALASERLSALEKEVAETKAAVDKLKDEKEKLEEETKAFESKEEELKKLKEEKTAASRVEALQAKDIYFAEKDTKEALASMDESNFQNMLAEREILSKYITEKASKKTVDTDEDILNSLILNKASMEKATASAVIADKPDLATLEDLYTKL